MAGKTDITQNAIHLRRAGRNALEWLKDDGSVSSLEMNGSIWLHMQDLQVVRQLEPVPGAAHPILSTSICGIASLDDGDLSIIGEPWLTTRTVRVTFTTREIGSADHDGLRDLQDTLGTTFSDVPLGTARVGFNRQDDELEEPPVWWASIDIPASSVDGLKEAIESDRLRAAQLGLCVSGICAPVCNLGDVVHGLALLLKPDSIDASDSPQIAAGYVTHLAFDLTKVSLERLQEP